ncbi:BnaC03g66610D [Brassica napus]|uniref:BnaC03g66610D protein n=2 Tax=Brassica napus TaxID=3708 RepID=A0A078GUH4_BRANA|nr:BnaC03g66610D [Brassica napus]
MILLHPMTRRSRRSSLNGWKKIHKCPSRFYQVLRTPLEWLTDHQIDAFINLLRQRYQDHPQHFRSERMCFLDHIFSRQWRASYPDFKSDKGDANGLGRRLPDRIIKHISPEELDEPYIYERQTIGVPQCRAGDCGPFTLKYIEFHALGMEFPKALCPRNGKTIREKMAVDIFQELPMCHEWENQDNDENLRTLGYVNRVRIGCCFL